MAGQVGPSGTGGASGYSGISGFSGRSGYSGYSGYSGLGTSGYSGYSGLAATINATDGTIPVRDSPTSFGNSPLTVSGGTVNTPGLLSVGNLQVASTSYLYWLASTTFRNRSDGVLTLSNFAENGFGRLQLGGTTSSFPALKQNGANLESKLADDSAYTGHVAVKFCYSGTTVCDFAGSGSPEGAVTASVGSTYRRTDGGANTSFYVKESGAGNTGWIAK